MNSTIADQLHQLSLPAPERTKCLQIAPTPTVVIEGRTAEELRIAQRLEREFKDYDNIERFTTYMDRISGKTR